MDLAHRIEKEFYESISGDVEKKGQYDADREKDKKETVLFGVNGRSLHGKHESSGKSRENVDQDKIDDTHVREPEEIAQRIFRKTGDQEEDKRDIHPFMLHEIIEAVDVVLFYYLLNEGQSQESRYVECGQRSEHEAGC